MPVAPLLLPTLVAPVPPVFKESARGEVVLKVAKPPARQSSPNPGVTQIEVESLEVTPASAAKDSFMIKPNAQKMRCAKTFFFMERLLVV